MKAELSVVAIVVAVAGLSGGAHAQSININFGPAEGAPNSGYAAAGLPGVWNSVFPVHGGPVIGLVDLNGDPIAANVRNIGGTALVNTNDPATTGDDEKLLDDYLVTFSASLETCLFFRDMKPGTYEVTMYCWVPAAPSTGSYATVDQSQDGAQIIGGEWTGQHEKFLTFSRHIAVVGVDGRLDTHSGIVPGEDPLDGAALNGVQLRHIPADLTADAIVNGADLASLLAQWGGAGAADLNGDGVVNGADLATLLASWG